MSAAIDVIVFDLGGVLVELQGLDVLLGAPQDTPHTEAFWHDWLLSPAVREFEAGRMTAETFAAALVSELDLPLTPEQFLANFLRWPRGFFAGAIALLQTLSVRHPLAVLSNTNALHWARFAAEPGFLPALSHSFLSFESGLLKPDAECFAHLTDTLGVAAPRILFLDDNRLNVEAARRFGLQAEQALGVSGARQVLSTRGLLT